eukprot:15339562-Heterocapsa_arctica.AAC.1
MVLQALSVDQSGNNGFIIRVNTPWFKEWETRYGMNQTDHTSVEVNLVELKLFDKRLDDWFTP